MTTSIGTGGVTFPDASVQAAAAARRMVPKTADETVNNSTVLQNDDHLLLAMGANEIWVCRLVIIYNSSAVADIKGICTLPVGATSPGGVLWRNSGGYAWASNPALTEWAADGTAANVIVIWHFVVINAGNAGNIQFQWAQNTGEATDTKVLAGSCLIADKIV